MSEIITVKRHYADHGIQRDPNIVAVGIGYKRTGGKFIRRKSIVFSVQTKVRDLSQIPPRRLIPQSIMGHPTDVIETGAFHALQSRTERHRPAPAGVSIGHRDVTAGTLGCLAYRDGETFIVSNNHVLANSNAGMQGDPVIQPGQADGGTVAKDQIAELAEFIPVNFALEPGQCPIANAVAKGASRLAKFLGSSHRFGSIRENGGGNLVDVALARPLDLAMVSGEILEVGHPQGTQEPVLGLPIMKSGRTTEKTAGMVTQMHVTVQVLYGPSIAIFEDQVMGELKCGGGDSGSIVLDSSRQVLGLLFAGTQDGKTTIFNRWSNVEAALGISILPEQR